MPHVPDHEATHLLPPHAASIVLARRAVEALPLQPARTGEVKLIVSELVTNSIEHGDLGAHDRIELRALVDGRGALHMEVRDPGRARGRTRSAAWAGGSSSAWPTAGAATAATAWRACGSSSTRRAGPDRPTPPETRGSGGALGGRFAGV
jgi:hypothetical protein